MRVSLVTLILSLLFFGCEKDNDFMMSDGNPPPPPPGQVDTTVSYLALGDSYTIGTSVEAEERWPYQLSVRLAERDYVKVEPLQIVARNGWRTDNLMNGLATENPASNFDLVSLLIGVNDQYQGFSVEGYRGRFEELLRSAIGYGGGDTSNVFVVSIPDYAYTPFGGGDPTVSAEIAEFNAAAREVTEGYGIPFYDITDISERGLQDPELVASDGLHPSGKQYGLWVEEVLLDKVARLIKGLD